MSAPRALIPATPKLPMLSRQLPVPLLQALPIAGRIAGTALAGLATEYILRAAAVRLLETLAPRARSSRAVITEVTVIERFRHD